MLAGRSRSLSPDTEGKYRPYLGFTWVDNGKKPKRWNLGRNKWEAEKRFQRLRVLYDEDSTQGPVKGCWTARGLRLGELIANGMEALQAAPPAPGDPRAVIEYQQYVEQLRSSYPSVPIEPTDPELYADSQRQNVALVSRHLKTLSAELRDVGALPAGDRLGTQTGVTVTSALKDFRTYLETSKKNKAADGSVSEWGKTILDQQKSLSYFLAEWLSLDLGKLGKTNCEAMIEHIASRPINQRGKNITHNTARHLIWLTRKFLEWMDGSEVIPWELPAKFRIDKRVTYREREIHEIKQDVVTITIPQLKILVANATELEKLYLGLALNCAYGADQLGRLQIEWFDVESGRVKGVRKKRMTASRHYYWQCNIDRLTRCFNGRTSGTVFVSPDGNNLYRKSENGNVVDKISSTFETLVQRVQGLDDKFPKFSFGKVRKTAATMMLEIADPHIASMLLAHKNISTDKLLTAYAKLPYEKLYETQKRLEKELVADIGL